MSPYPAWGDFVAVVGMGALMFLGLYGVVLLSRKYKAMMKERIKAALRKRRNVNDTFRAQNGYSWDMVMVFKIYDDIVSLNDHQTKHSMKYILGQLTAGGLETRLFYSFQHKEVYCKIRASLDRLMKEADRIDLQIPLDPEELRKACLAGRSGFWEPLGIPDQSPQTPLSPYDYMFAKFCYDDETQGARPDMKDVYKKWPSLVFRPKTGDVIDKDGVVRSPMIDASSGMPMLDEEPDIHYSVFRGADRLKLMLSIITSHNVGGCYLDIFRLVKKECILGFFPLHDIVELRTIEEKWLRLFQAPWKQQVDVVKDYFGEKIALYFLWLGHYTTWLIPVSILGILTWIWIAADNNNPDAPTVPYFAGIIALWSSLFLEFWKRKEKMTAMKWGMVGFEEEEQTRPQFTGTPSKSPIDGRAYLYFSRYERIQRSMHSQMIIFGFIIALIGVIAAIFAIRITISKFNVTAGGIVSSLLIALQIQVMNEIYSKLALKLNNYENHRTDTEYEDSLIAKTFLFQFVNSFASLFYIGFVKPYLLTIDPCANNACMVELQTTLGTIFLTRLAVGNITELCVPLVTQYLASNQRDQVVQKSRSTRNVNTVSNGNESEPMMEQDLSEVEKTFLLSEYDVMLGTFEDYAELVIQFGYTTMFVAAFPLACTMSLVNNYVEMRVDAWKLCQLMRRPIPRSCEDIGTWQVILEIIAAVAVFTNSGLVAFTGGSIVNDQWPIRVWIFILMSAGLFSIRLLVMYIIPDVPTEVEIQLKRKDFILSKILDNVGDDDDTLEAGYGFTPDYTVKGTDTDPM